MARQVKKRIFAGAVCQQTIYSIGEKVKNIDKAKPRIRFKTEEERAEHRRLISRRQHARKFNEAFGPTSIYSTHTFDDEHEVHTFEEAKRIRDNYFRRLTYAYPEAKIMIYMGRGKSTSRIHMHMVSDGIPVDFIFKQWCEGDVKHHANLRENNYYNGQNCGRDYTGLANYLFDHWTAEQGGHRYKWTRKTIRVPEPEPATECKRMYRPDMPPICPKGYTYIRCDYNRYGYMCFHYIKTPPKGRRRLA